MDQTLHWSASLGAGLLLGGLNWAFWSFQTRRLIGKAKVHWGPLFALSIIKLGVLGLILWVLLIQKWVDPLFFLIGFSIVVIAHIAKGFIK
ncbi:MAG: hypothetical protein U1D33_01270, partial [bacterium]|nr:hypothetical protein [bacterium]